MGDRRLFVEDELVNLAVDPSPPRTDPSLNGGDQGVFPAGDFDSLSPSTDVSLDIPGRGLVTPAETMSVTSSVWFFRYAAEPKPLSCVWRKNEGSFAPSDCAISDLDVASSLVGAGSTLARGDLAALFSDATIDSGRLLPLTVPRDEGRCCHDNVPERERDVAVPEESLEGCEDIEKDPFPGPCL